MRHSAAGSRGERTGQRPGARLGRGHTAARFAGEKLTPMSRRVTIKTLLVNQQRASPQSLAKHLRYIERDGSGRDGESGRAYGPQTDEADRTSVGSGKRVSVRVDLGGRTNIKKKKKRQY